MWAVFYLGEEGEKLRRILMNHQIPKTQTIIEAVRTRLTHLKKQCLGILWNFVGKLGHIILE